MTTIRLNSKFYSKDAVEQAIQAFEGLCNAKVLNDQMDIELSCTEDSEHDIEAEFMNYVLAVMKNEGMV